MTNKGSAIIYNEALMHMIKWVYLSV